MNEEDKEKGRLEFESQSLPPHINCTSRNQKPSHTTTTSDPKLKELLSHYPIVFNIPHGLPPS